MKKLKEMWDAKYPDHKHVAANTLSDNARRLTKLKIVPPQEIQIITDTKPKAINVAEVVDVIEQIRPTNIENRIEQPNMESTGDICQEELKNLIEQLRKIFKTTLPIIQEGNIDRKPLPKTVLTKLEELAANIVLKEELDNNQSDMTTINAAIYAIAISVMEARGQKKKSSGASRNKANHTITKMQQRMKELKQLASKTASEVDSRKKGRKASSKEKDNIKLLKKKLNITRGDLSLEALTEFKHQCINNIKVIKERIRVKSVTIARRKNNTEFEKNEAAFNKNLKETNKYEGSPPNIKKFEDFWANIWETEGKINREASWMKEMKEEIKNEVKISHQKPKCSVQRWRKIIIKKKNWSSPGIDGIQNYWIKKMTALWEAEVNEINKYLKNEKEIPDWLGRGRTVLIPKSNDLTKTDKYRPITCLITMYKNFTAVKVDIMTEHLKLNNLWDEQQKGTRSNIMGTADNLLVDRCMLEEVKEYQRTAAAAYYDYQ